MCEKKELRKLGKVSLATLIYMGIFYDFSSSSKVIKTVVYGYFNNLRHSDLASNKISSKP